MCPGSHSSATFSTTCSFPAWSSPSHDFHLFWGFFLTFPRCLAWEQQYPQFLPAPQPGSLLCIHTQRQVRTWAGAHGVGNRCTQHSPRARWPIWPWEPARSPTHLFSLWCLMILCWSCLSAVRAAPKWAECPSHSRLERTRTASVLMYLLFSWRQQSPGYSLDENRTKLSITFLHNFRFGLYKGKVGKRKGWGKTAGREGTLHSWGEWIDTGALIQPLTVTKMPLRSGSPLTF